MGFIPKDRTVSGQTILKESVAYDNVNFIRHEYDMLSNDPKAVPSQASVVDYVKAYVTAPQIEGNQQNPTDLYIAFLLKEQGIRVRSGQTVIYFYVVNGKRVDSKSLKYTPDNEFTVDFRYELLTEEEVLISNYLLYTDEQDLSPFFHSFWNTNTGSFTGSAFTKYSDRIEVDDADVNEFAGTTLRSPLEIGAVYNVTFTISNSNGNDLLVGVGSGILSYSGSATVDSNGTHSFSFTASHERNTFLILGRGSTTCTISAPVVSKDITASKTIATVTFPRPAKFKWGEYGNRDNDFGGTSTLTVGSTLPAEDVRGDTYDTSVAPHTFELTRTAKGTSFQRIILEAEYEEVINDDGEPVTLTGNITYIFYIRVEES